MWSNRCRQEDAVLASLVRGAQDPALERHLDSCAHCREVVRVARFMRLYAAQPEPPHALPEVGTLWWKACLLRKWDAEGQAAKRMERPQRFEIVLATAGIVTLVGWLWPRIDLWGLAFGEVSTRGWSALLPGHVALLGVTAVLVALTTLVVLPALLERD